ncbi:alkylated DNA repair protein [Salinimicrobium marinum]|uniref:Alkylated DNA repair protein n=1 Tax=Salinimicrobium marinum TaxID=680283 RepID=A0A918SHW2_9FLAO|nr:alpha-ketoglutarate-dependent dioxygenase AlkB [Salinimicrobium marinum]GHA39762.1 alkylated DNA repair protein [Salinimicrobium marinum]
MVTELFPLRDPQTPLVLKNSEIYFYQDFFDAASAENYNNSLHNKLPWQQDSIKLFGKVHPQPRLTALFGNNQKPYTYSNITMHPHPFSPELLEIKKRIEEETKEEFTTCLANLYRSGQDSMGWHADDEKELGRNPAIASVSFGAPRMFHLKHKTDPTQRYKIRLPSGSLLLMKGPTQHFWLHQIPKTSRPLEPRINLTFRSL